MAGAPRRGWPSWIGPTVLAGSLIGALVGLIVLLAQRDHESSSADLDRHARTAAADVVDRLDANREYLRLFAEDLTRGASDQGHIAGRMNRYLADHSELLYAVHIGADGAAVQVIPEAFADSAGGDWLASDHLRKALKAAEFTGSVQYTAPHLLGGGQRGFEVIVPVPDRKGDALVGVYDVDRLLRSALSRETILLHQAGISDDDGAVVASLPALGSVDTRLVREVSIDPPGHGLHIRLARYGAGLWSWGITAVVAICIGLAIGSAYAIWMLNRQIERRLVVERALEQARDRLEERVKERTSDLVDANRRLETEMTRRLEVEERSRRHQDQLAHVARLSTMGEMAAGLAHEINQPLAAIAAFTRAGIRHLDAESPDYAALREALGDASEQAQRAGKIVHRLREFIAERATEHHPHDLSELTRTVIGLLEGEFKRTGVVCDANLGVDLPMVDVDGIQIEQVIMNMMRNGIEAMDSEPAERRRLSVTTRSNDDGTLTFQVDDLGPGCTISPPNRIFDPFYTTKAEGMGMGLSISQTIIEAHEGRVFAASRDGGGMSIGFHLPIAHEGIDHGGTERTTREPTFGRPRRFANRLHR